MMIPFVVCMRRRRRRYVEEEEEEEDDDDGEDDITVSCHRAADAVAIASSTSIATAIPGVVVIIRIFFARSKNNI